MDIEKFFTFVIGLISLATAWFSYKKALTDKKAYSSTEPKQHKIVRFTDPTVRTRGWAMRKTKYLFALPSILYSVLTILFFREAFISVFSVAVTILLIIFLSLSRDMPPSRTIKTAEFTIKGSREKILRECLGALERSGVRVGRFDTVEGIIEGSTTRPGWTGSQIITVQVGKPGPKGVSLRVSSGLLDK